MPAVQILAPSDQFIQNQRQSISLPIKPNPHSPTSLNHRLPFSHLLRVKNAEFWLILGETDEAVWELEALPQSAWNHPSAIKVRVAAVEVFGGRTGAIVLE